MTQTNATWTDEAELAYENERYDEIRYCEDCNTYFTIDEACEVEDYNGVIYDGCPKCGGIDTCAAEFDIDDEDEEEEAA